MSKHDIKLITDRNSNILEQLESKTLSAQVENELLEEYLLNINRINTD